MLCSTSFSLSLSIILFNVGLEIGQFHQKTITKLVRPRDFFEVTLQQRSRYLYREFIFSLLD